MIRADVIIKVVCSARWDTAAGVAWRATIARAVRLRVDTHWFDRLVSSDHAHSRRACLQMADDVRTQPDLAICWRLLAVDPKEPAPLIDLLHGICAAVKRADPDAWPQFAPRLKVLREIARGQYIGEFGSIFHIAATHLRNEIAADVDDGTAPAKETPPSTSVAVRLLLADNWDSAHAEVVAATETRFARDGRHMPDRLRDVTIERASMREMIKIFADDILTRGGALWTGDLAIAWMMLAADPAHPETLHAVMPSLQRLFAQSVVYSSHDGEICQARLDVWWRVATGEFKDSKESVFEIAFNQHEFAGRIFSDDDESESDDSAVPSFLRRAAEASQRRKSPLAGPSVVVMTGKGAVERGMPQAWKDLRDQALELVVARDIERVRATLHREFPHAHVAVKALTRDLREGKPVRTQPMILVGDPGTGKSRLVRRFADLLELHIYGYDGAGAHDGTYAGSAKSWSSAQPSVPARAIMMSQTANPIAVVDEIEKAGSSTYNGNLWNAMIPFLERETSSRYREQGLDAQLDLSHVIHITTANSIDPLPGPLRDRFRILRIPRPTLEHLPGLIASIMAELAEDVEERFGDQPFAADELEAIGREWVRQKFSLRRLQRMVITALDVRDNLAPRH